MGTLGPMEPPLALVHLVRAANGWEPFDRFMTSYEAHPAGVGHRLVAACKGFADEGLPKRYRMRLEQHAARVLLLPDTGFDIGTYWAAAGMLSNESLCFLNSYSVVLDDGWLGKLAHHGEAGVGIVGASGSWQSHNTLSWDWIKHGVRLLRPRDPVAAGSSMAADLTGRSRRALVRLRILSLFRYPPFPNPHIRTNAFLMRRELMLALRVPTITSKDVALLFESGRRGLTSQVRRLGLAVLVVGRDGLAYSPERWPESHTYRLGDQTNLLVSDNRTEEWAAYPPGLKEASSVVAWGRDAIVELPPDKGVSSR